MTELKKKPLFNPEGDPDVRQRHIDQAQSMNLYITNDYTMRQVLALYLDAWRSGVKTIYYIRSKSLEVEDCESCAS